MFSKAGLAFFIFIFSFSPKIPLSISGSLVFIRLDDLLVPALFLIWLSELLLKKRRLVYSRLYLPLGSYFIVGLIATLLGYYSHHPAVDPLYCLGVILRSGEYYIIFFLAVNILKTKKQIIDYLHVWTIAAVAVALYGIADHILGISGPTGLYDRGWFSHQSNHMGGFLMVSLTVVLGLFHFSRRRRTKLLFAAGLTVISCAILFNLSRTTYISALAALSVFYALHNRKLLVIPVICAVTLFVIVPAIFPNAVLGRRAANIVSDIFSTRIEHRDAFDSMALHRAKCLYVFRDFPRDILFGKGLGFYPLYEYDSQIALVPVATGVVGVVVFFWLLAAVYTTATGVYSSVKDAELRSVTKAFIAAYCGVLVHSITSTAFMIALIAYPFWLLTGIVSSISRLSACQNN
jgi:hypothetical protein